MNWEEFKREVRKNPFLLWGLFTVLLGLFTMNATLIWMGAFLVLLLILLSEGKKE
ncbi:hypothetical protein [Thermococcus sp. GR6]|uniref:hypothetical protein n=1 Tax=Thermococcus sp. GR6 TaxID=1638256 RepID=UPI001430829C|nr:hypothetical protein [Thermococcus sp. GR6]